MMTPRSIVPRGLALAALLAAATLPAAAQTPNVLPTAPGAQRATDGGTTAGASLPGTASPLEPYLVTWLLPVGGLLSVAFMVFVDKRMRA